MTGRPVQQDLGGIAFIHLAGVVLVPTSIAAGVFEFHRAREGNLLSWSYAVEWPMIAAYGVYVWIRLTRERSGRPAGRVSRWASRGLSRRPSRGAMATPSSAAGQASAAVPAVEDEGLRAWQAYLADLNAKSPPGGPPPTNKRYS